MRARGLFEAAGARLRAYAAAPMGASPGSSDPDEWMPGAILRRHGSGER